MYSGIIPIIKQAAVEAVEASQPVNVTFGLVTSVSPLKVQVTPKLVLGDKTLIMTKTAKDSGLSKGDKLILVRVQGGQSYIVLDKAVS